MQDRRVARAEQTPSLDSKRMLIVVLPYDQNRTRRVTSRAVGNRTEPRAFPKTVAVRAEDDQICIPCLLNYFVFFVVIRVVDNFKTGSRSDGERDW